MLLCKPWLLLPPPHFLIFTRGKTSSSPKDALTGWDVSIGLPALLEQNPHQPKQGGDNLLK